MEKKLVRVPFEVELAKKIAEKSVEGKIVTREGKDVRVVCWDKKGGKFPIIALVKEGNENEETSHFTVHGMFYYGKESAIDLMLEIPEYTTFKDGDILICECGTPFIYKDTKDRHGNFSAYCGIDLQGTIFFDMKGWTYSIKGYANEEQKKIIIDALKLSKEPKAKEYLKRFFNIEVKPECEFKPKDWILIRDDYEDMWCLDIYSHKVWDKDEECYHYYCVGGWSYQCIPYNDQTKHLLGTTDNWEE